MKIVFLGTPEFSVIPLKKLIDNNCGFKVIAVGTNRDKPIGRKQVLTPSPVKIEALKHRIPVFEYDKIRVEGVDDLKKLNPDLIVTCAFGQILSQEILDIPKFGVINIHASLLPDLRGASPIHYAILKGYKKTGITIMKTVFSVDAGDILVQKSLEIGKNETTGELFNRLSNLGGEMIVPAIKSIFEGTAVFTSQNEEKATFTKMIKKSDAKIDWGETCENIINKIRAYNPAPIAYTFLDGEMLKIFSARKSSETGKIGEIIKAEDNLIIACKDGAVEILELQKAGSKKMHAKEFLRGAKLIKGTILHD